jgi:chorismate-pyruvate lyase
MSSGRLVYDVEWVKADGTVTRILEGIADTTAEVTR